MRFLIDFTIRGHQAAVMANCWTEVARAAGGSSCPAASSMWPHGTTWRPWEGVALLWCPPSTLPLGKLLWAKTAPSSTKVMLHPHPMTIQHGHIKNCPFSLKSHSNFRTACRVRTSQTALQLNLSFCPVLFPSFPFDCTDPKGTP